MDYAVAKHKETTDTARQALKLTEDLKGIQNDTNEMLYDQGKQLYRVGDNFHEMQSDVQHADKLLDFMRSCCCLAFCCGCCYEPTEKAAIKDGRYQGSEFDGNYVRPPNPKSNQVFAPHEMTRMRDTYDTPNTAGLEKYGFGKEKVEIDNESKQQNNYLDQVSNNLKYLADGAKAQAHELQHQAQHLDNLDRNADTTKVGLDKLNHKTKLTYQGR